MDLKKKVNKVFEYFKPFEQKPSDIKDVFMKIQDKNLVFIQNKNLKYYKYLCIYYSIYHNLLNYTKIFPSYYILSLYLKEIEDIDFDLYSIPFKFGIVVLNTKVPNKQEVNILTQFCDFYKDRRLFVIETQKNSELLNNLTGLGFYLL